MTRLLILLISLFTASVAIADIVKLSKNGLCHEADSPYYSRIKHYQAFETLSQCLDAVGGVLRDEHFEPEHIANQRDVYDERPYSREAFGKRGWMDEDSDCQNTRHEILESLSTRPVQYKDKQGCKVERGRWISPFTNRVHFEAKQLDIDHIVPLAWSWSRGANKWTNSERERFANDPRNLWPVEAKLNRQKGAKGLDEWLPPENRCQYIARFERIRKIYKLSLFPNEVGRYEALVKSCQREDRAQVKSKKLLPPNSLFNITLSGKVGKP